MIALATFVSCGEMSWQPLDQYTLYPLSALGLWDAVTITPATAPSWSTAHGCGAIATTRIQKSILSQQAALVRSQTTDEQEWWPQPDTEKGMKPETRRRVQHNRTRTTSGVHTKFGNMWTLKPRMNSAVAVSTPKRWELMDPSAR
jgi:hypothetical protein